jgi:NAD(P)-dependent dehydrogenase (short-subunit alcohol dehydrogenase family)
VRADVTRAADVKAMVEAAQQRFGGLDILVNNAGMGPCRNRSKSWPRRASTAS